VIGNALKTPPSPQIARCPSAAELPITRRVAAATLRSSADRILPEIFYAVPIRTPHAMTLRTRCLLPSFLPALLSLSGCHGEEYIFVLRPYVFPSAVCHCRSPAFTPLSLPILHGTTSFPLAFHWRPVLNSEEYIQTMNITRSNSRKKGGRGRHGIARVKQMYHPRQQNQQNGTIR